MADPEKVLTDTEVVHIEPADGENVGDEGDTPDGDTPDGDAPAADGTTPGPKESIVGRNAPVTPPAPEPVVDHTAADPDAMVRQPGETANEFALRRELTKTRRQLKSERTAELLGTQQTPAPTPKKELSAASAAALSKYKPEEIASLKEVMPAIAEELGFVRADQLQSQTYAEKSQAYLDAFLDKHPEYVNDPALWKSFTEEFSVFKQPADPRDFPRLFNKAHQEVMGLKPAKTGGAGTTAAAAEKVTVASRGSAAAPSNTAPRARTTAPQGVRLDMLKGFTEDEIKELSGD